MKFSQYTTKNIEEVLRLLKTSESGLSQKEAENRLKEFGFNEIKTKEVGLFDIFLRQFKSPFTYLLLAAAFLAFFVGEKIDGFVILTFILINITLGFLQENRAHHAVSLLRKYFQQKTRIQREGKEEVIDKRFLVAGDIVLLESGDIVPADLRMLKTDNFLVDESVLSGESAPIAKISQVLAKEAKEIFKAQNIVFSGTSVVSGKAEGVVISTGREAFSGEIAKLVSGLTRESAYEKELFQFCRLILKIVVTAILFIFIGHLIIRGTRDISDFLLFCIALIVSIIPEALPVITTFALSQGALKMAKEKVVAKRLSAIEDLGNIEILCSDKTGTLTENKLRLERIFARDPDKCLLFSLLSSSFIKEEISSSLNPFDAAQFQKASPEIKESLKNFRAVCEIPFDPFRLRNSFLVKGKEGQLFLITKGAPEAVLKLCSEVDGGLAKDQIQRQIEKEGRGGKRALAVAFKKLNKNNFCRSDEKNFTFLGFSTFVDPLKSTAKESIGLAQKMGLMIKILSGDGKEVTGAVAKEVGLIEDPGRVILGEELNELSEEDFEKQCHNYSVFARVSPETKLKIIQTLQKKFEVGFLGEGINDTPALKVANVGIAVQEAADVPREAADVILLEKDLRVIINGIKNGRIIFSNINKYIKCALASNFGNFYSIAVISLFITFLPMLPIQILLGNLLSDFPLISIATDNLDIEELRKPKYYRLNQSVRLIIALALVSTVFDFIFFAVFFRFQPAVIQTLWFIESILTEIVLIFIIRTRHFFLKAKKPSFPLAFFTVADAIFIVLLPFTKFGREFFHFVSLPLSALFTVFFLVFNYFIISEIVKLIYFKLEQKQAAKKNNFCYN